MNGYIGFYNQQRIEIYAVSLYAAKLQTIEIFKVKKNKQHLITVMLAEKNGTPIVHNPAIL